MWGDFHLQDTRQLDLLGGVVGSVSSTRVSIGSELCGSFPMTVMNIWQCYTYIVSCQYVLLYRLHSIHLYIQHVHSLTYTRTHRPTTPIYDSAQSGYWRNK